MFNLKDRVALVTGASQGIGRATSLALAAAGARVIAGGAQRRKTRERRAGNCRGGRGKALAVQMDVAEAEQIKAAFRQGLERFGHLDILVNNAADHPRRLGRAPDGGRLGSRAAHESDGRAPLCIQQALAAMLRRRHGRIINVTSVVAETGNAGQANYVAAKAWPIGLTRAIAAEVASRNITVNAVAPGFVVSPMTDPLPQQVKDELFKRIPLGRMGQDAEVAAAIVFSPATRPRTSPATCSTSTAECAWAESRRAATVDLAASGE